MLQFFLIVAGFSPLAILAVEKAGGWQGITRTLGPKMTESWGHMAHASDNPMGVELIGLFMGLGFVLSFGYWCTNYLVVQRAMAARDMTDARNTPIVGAFPKMLIPFVVIVPGIAAMALGQMNIGFAVASEGGRRPGLRQGSVQPDGSSSTSPGMLGVGLTALIASFMSGMAGNVTAFNTVWTYDIYQSYIRKDAPDSHYLWMGRMATIFGVTLSIGAAYLATQFNNMMDFLQLIFGFVNAPLFATFLLGMFWKRATEQRRFHGPGLGHGRRGADLRRDARRRQGRLHRPFLGIQDVDGAELLGGHRRFLVLPSHHRCDQLFHHPAASGGASPDWSTASSRSRDRARRLVQAARRSRHSRGLGLRRAEFRLLLRGTGAW